MYKHNLPPESRILYKHLVGEREFILEEAGGESIHRIDQIPNQYPHYPYQATVPLVAPIVTPFVAPVFPTFIPPAAVMASGIQDCSLITPPDTPSSQSGNLSELFGAPRRYSSREHKQTSFFAATDLEMDNPRKRKRNIMGGTAKIAPRRMLKFDPPEITESKDLSTSVPALVALLDDAQEESSGLNLDSPREIAEEIEDEMAEEMSKDLGPRDDASLDRENSEDEVINEADYPISTLVWGKLKGFDWWPGRISSHVEIGGLEPLPDGSLWVKWFGENQVSEMSIVSLAEFGSFAEHFTPAKLRGLYKKAVIQTLKEAARRCGKEFVGRPEDKSLKAYNIGLLEQGTVKAEVLEETNETSKGLDSPSLAYDDQLPLNGDLATRDNQIVDMQSTDINTDDSKSDAGTKKTYRRKKKAMRRTVKEKNLVYLTQLEKEMLDWGIGGFLPMGPTSFQPTESNFYPLVTAFGGGGVVNANSSVAAGGSVATVKDKTLLINVPPVNGAASNNNTPSSLSSGAVKSLHFVPGRNSKENFTAVAENRQKITELCISCGSMAVAACHPLFQGGLCKKCKENFMECVYLFDDDGSQMYCTICCGGDEVFMCDAPNCSKVYCGICIERLCGREELERVQQAETWECYLCSPEHSKLGLLCKRDNWLDMLKELFSNDYEVEYDPPEFISPIPAEERKPIRVLALFDGIATGMQVFKELGIEVGVYVSSEIDLDAVKVVCVKHKEVIHVGDIEQITEKQVLSARNTISKQLLMFYHLKTRDDVMEWGPFDLVLGGSPCNDLSIVNPARKGIYEGTGRLFFEFFRILSYAKPHPDQKRPFFWLFENVVSMKAQDKQTISRFLQVPHVRSEALAARRWKELFIGKRCNPVIVDAKDISAAHRARYFWGNLPGMNRPPVPLPGDRLTLQDCLEENCRRRAQFVKMRTITTKMNSVKQTKKAIMPVYMDGEGGDVLWCTEMERLFGFPDHYTDVANLGRCGRQRLLGKAWSIPVIRHLLSPLKDYFKSSPISTHTDHRY